MDAPCETFPALSALPGIHHGFATRVEGLALDVDRGEAMRLLKNAHAEVLRKAGLADRPFIFAQQVHGNAVATVDSHTVPLPVLAVDGLITNDPAVCLGIYVADCAPVYLVDTRQPAIGLLHSGRKGTELGIVRVAIQTMTEQFGTRPQDLLVQIGPCIRPPNYESDFAATIREDAFNAGAGSVQDCGICTGADVNHYYSYRLEKGRTGRMLAFLALKTA